MDPNIKRDEEEDELDLSLSLQPPPSPRDPTGSVSSPGTLPNVDTRPCQGYSSGDADSQPPPITLQLFPMNPSFNDSIGNSQALGVGKHCGNSSGDSAAPPARSPVSLLQLLPFNPPTNASTDDIDDSQPQQLGEQEIQDSCGNSPPPPLPVPQHELHVARPANDNDDDDVSQAQRIGEGEAGDGPAEQQRRRVRRNPTRLPREGKSVIIVAPFPWAANRRATVLSLALLITDKQIDTVSGKVACRRCEGEYEIEYNLVEKFREIWDFIAQNKSYMRERAPGIWVSPRLPRCRMCGQEQSVRPAISEKKRDINWLFLLLGQCLGCCSLGQLRYFCKHTNTHRTGAKDRLLYLTYLGLCHQLDPTGPFHRD